MSTRPSTTRRAMPRVALEVRRASRSSCRSSASRRRTSTPDSRSTVPSSSSISSYSPSSSSRKASATSSTAAWKTEPGDRVRLDAGRDAVHRCEVAPRSCLADGHHDGRGRHDVELEVLDAILARMRPGMGEDGEHVVAVRLEQRSRAATVARGRHQHLDRVGVERRRDRLQDVLPRRVDEVDPLRGHGAPRLAPGSAVAGCARQEAAAADSAAWRCSLSQRSASSAAAQPDPAAVTAWRYTWSWTSPAANTPGMFVSRRLPAGQEVPGVGLVVELVEEERGVRIVADGDEHAVGVEDGLLSRHRVDEPHARDLAVPEHFFDDLVEQELDLLVRAGAVDHDRRGAELVAAVDDDHLAREPAR